MRVLDYNKLKILLFSLALGVLFLTSVLHKPEKFSEAENRYLAEMPSFGMKNLMNGSFMKDYETYIVDQFPNRGFFTGIKTLSERARGRQDDSEVYFGKEGYLFGKYDTALFEGEISKRNVGSLVKFGKENISLGKEHFQIIMVPSSSQILEDKLPFLAPIYDQDILTDSIKNQIGEDFVLDTSRILKEKKDEYIYYRTDHHWTTLGAYYVYAEYMKKTGREPKKLEAFLREEIKEDFLGTYDSKVNTKISGGVIPDRMVLYSTVNEAASTMILDGKEETAKKGIFERKHLETKDKYSVFMGGNHGITDIRTDVQNDRSLLVLKDSFAHSLVPFLMEDYSRIVMVDLRHFNKSLKKFRSENTFTDVLVLYSTADFVTDNNIIKLLR